MKLLIISHMPHYRRGDTIVGWGPTVQEIDHLATLFDQVRHVAPLHDEPAPASSLPYSDHRIRLVPVHPAGGERFRDKLGILARYPGYLRTIVRELEGADVLHVRCPANISMLAVGLMPLLPAPKRRWIKYAGNWKPTGGDVWTYDLQRWWLERPWHKGLVTVNGRWPGQPEHIRTFLNPCLTAADLEEGKRVAVTKELSLPLRMLYVGRVETPKGTGRAVEIVRELVRRGLACRLDVVGDGEERPEFERRAEGLPIEFHGWLPRPALAAFFRQAHVSLLPTKSSEGWPKVLSEGMAYGLVPVAGRVSSIPQYLERVGAGRSIEGDDLSAFADALVAYAERPGLWKEESRKAVQAAASFSYDAYLEAVRALLGIATPAPDRNGVSPVVEWSL